MVPVIQLEDVTKVFLTDEVETHALSNIRIQIERGEFVSIVGFSGSGKTTLISILAGLLAPDSGVVLLNGVQINMQSPVSFGAFAVSSANSNIGGEGCTFIGDGAGWNSSGLQGRAISNGLIDRGAFPGNGGYVTSTGGQIF